MLTWFCAGLVTGSVLLAGTVIALTVLDGRQYPPRRFLLTINGKRFLEIQHLRSEQVRVFHEDGSDGPPIASGDIHINLQAAEAMEYALDEQPTVTH